MTQQMHADSQMKASYLKNAPSTLLKLYYSPLYDKRTQSNRCPLWELLQNTRN